MHRSPIIPPDDHWYSWRVTRLLSFPSVNSLWPTHEWVTEHWVVTSNRSLTHRLRVGQGYNSENTFHWLIRMAGRQWDRPKVFSLGSPRQSVISKRCCLGKKTLQKRGDIKAKYTQKINKRLEFSALCDDFRVRSFGRMFCFIFILRSRSVVYKVLEFHIRAQSTPVFLEYFWVATIISLQLHAMWLILLMFLDTFASKPFPGWSRQAETL